MYRGEKVILRALDNSDLMRSLDFSNDYDTMRGATSGLLLPSTVDDEARLFSTRVAVGEVNYLPYDRPAQPVRVQAKLRYTTKFADALLIPTENGCELRFDTPQRAATPGQTAAFYDGEYLIGGGTILGTIEE